MTTPWFARRFPLNDPRSAMAPASWQGWAVAIGFMIAMVVGGLAFVIVGIAFGVLMGAAVFALIAMLAAAVFLGLSAAKGDPARTVDEIRNA